MALVAGTSGPQDTTPLSEAAADLLRRTPVRDARTSLLVFHARGSTLVSLAPGTAVVVGREAPSDVVVPDRSLSRRHARFAWDGDAVTVEDLGSTNGTVLRGARVERATLGPDDVVTLGAVAVAIHRLAPGRDGHAGGGLDVHDRFRAALDDEVLRARELGRAFALVLARTPDDAGALRLGALLPRVLRPVDRLARFGPGCIEILLPEGTVAAARELAGRIVRLGADETGASRVVCALTAFPGAASGADELLQQVWEAARGVGDDAIRVVGVDAARSLGGPTPGGTVVESAAMRDLWRTVERLARSVIPVLLLGETGTGKEVVARAIHQRGSRRERPLVCVNCAAIPSQLVESTLFGHERGAFTGAAGQHRGVFEAADGGTVLLDEVGELPLPVQAALLRVLETKRVMRVGSTREVDVDVRVVAATHRDLEAMVRSGQFREDLLFRLNVMTLALPPLRERIDEIAPLALQFLEQASRDNERPVSSIDPEAFDLMLRYAWPGNVRELKNVVERAVVVAEGDRVTAADLPERVRRPATVVATRPIAPGAAPPRAPTRPPPEPDPGAAVAPDPAGARAPLESAPHDDARAGAADMKSQMQRYEAVLIYNALKKVGWNQSEAARELRIPLRTLVHKIKVYGIKKLGYGLG